MYNQMEMELQALLKIIEAENKQTKVKKKEKKICSKLTEEIASEVIVADNLHNRGPIPVVAPLEGVHKVEAENQWASELTIAL